MTKEKATWRILSCDGRREEGTGGESPPGTHHLRAGNIPDEEWRRQREKEGSFNTQVSK